MKFYDCSTAPSPRRVRMFIAEKGLDIPTVQVNLRNNEQLSDWFRELNPWCTVPVLELDDGTAISEAIAVSQFLEDMFPDPPLMGVGASDRSIVAMWNHRCEIDGFLAAGEAFRNAAKGLSGRALTGPDKVEQIPELAIRGRARVERFFAAINQQLATHQYIAGDRYSIADITAQIAVDFAGWTQLRIPEDHQHANRWFDDVRKRPSAQLQ